MRTRTLLLLTVVAGSLLAFILLVERHELSSADLENRRGKLLETFLRARVDRIEITRGKERVLLVKTPETGSEEGEWRVEAPLSAEVDGSAIDTLLAALEWAQPRRMLDGIDAKDRQRFGFDAPRVKASFRVGKHETTLRIGAEDPMEGGYYLQRDDESRAFIVGKDLFEALDHGPDHFRSKKLFSGLLAGTANRFRTNNEKGEVSARLREGRWWLDTPYAGLASTAAIDDVHRKLEELEAARFIDDAPRDLGAYGLTKPFLRVSVERPTPADAKKNEERLLEVGAPCATHEGERYARAQKGGIVCVRETDLESFMRSVEDFRETRLLTARDHELESISVKAKASELELRSTDGVWTRVGPKGDASKVADGSVTEWIDAFRTVSILEMVPAAPEHGFASPRATLTLHRGGKRADEVLKLGARRGDRVFVQRDDEPWALALDVSHEDLFSTSATRFRDRELIAEAPDRLFEFDVEREGVRERIARANETFTVVAPSAGPADGARAKELVTLVAQLAAVRFVADRPAAPHGLDRPRFTLRIRFHAAPETPASTGPVKAKVAPAREYILRIGAATSDGAFATLGDDSAVFVVPLTLVDAVEGPFLRKDVLAIEESELASLAIERGGKTVEFEKDGPGFRVVKGASTSNGVEALVTRLERLRAAEVRYTPVGSKIERPRALVRVRRNDGRAPSEYAFAIGEAVGEGEEARVRVRRLDLEAEFLFPKEAIEPFVAFPSR